MRKIINLVKRLIFNLRIDNVIEINREVSINDKRLVELIEKFKDYVVSVDEKGRFVYFNYTIMSKEVKKKFREELERLSLEYLIDQPRIYRVKL